MTSDSPVKAPVKTAVEAVFDARRAELDTEEQKVLAAIDAAERAAPHVVVEPPPPASDTPVVTDPPVAQDPPVLIVAGADPAKMVVAIDFADGASLVFDGATGTDAGTFVDTVYGISQRCIRVDAPNSALTVFLRPETDGSRLEVVFELGRLWGDANRAAAHLGAYTATIKYDGAVLATIAAPYHWWFSRWRWQSAPRPIVKMPAELIAANLIPNFSLDVAAPPVPMSTPAEWVYRNPMDTAGIETGMGNTGERPDIGYVTQGQAEYLLRADAGSLAGMMAWAEASGSIPFHFRDENTSAPVDLYAYPTANIYWQDQGNGVWIKRTPDSNSAPDGTVCPWSLDYSHFPAVTYLPYLMTGDPYYLEALQFTGTLPIITSLYFSAMYKLRIPEASQTRGWAWALRNLFQLAKITPEQPPSWLRSRSEWQHHLDDARTYFEQQFVSNQTPFVFRFHSGPVYGWTSPWQEDFVAFVYACGVAMGFEEWRSAYLWKLQYSLARANGKSGWPAQVCASYRIVFAPGLGDQNTNVAAVPDTQVFKDWSEVWAYYKATPEFNQGLNNPFTDDVSYQQSPANVGYLSYLRGTLAIAITLGVSEAAEPFAFVDNLMKQTGGLYNKWSIMP